MAVNAWLISWMANSCIVCITLWLPTIVVGSKGFGLDLHAVLQKCGYELQESMMLSLSTRHHDYGRQSRDDSQGYYSAFRGGGYEADASGADVSSSGYGEGAQSGLGMFDRMHLGNDISEGDEDEDSEDESSDHES